MQYCWERSQLPLSFDVFWSYANVLWAITNLLWFSGTSHVLPPTRTYNFILEFGHLVISLCPGFIHLEVCDVAMVSGCHATFSLVQTLGFIWSSFSCPSSPPALPSPPPATSPGPVLRFKIQGWSEALTVSLTLSLTRLCSIICKLCSQREHWLGG